MDVSAFALNLRRIPGIRLLAAPVCAVAIVCSAVDAKAGAVATVNVSFTATTKVFLDSNGVPLAQGSILRLGAFINPALTPMQLEDFIRLTDDFTALNNIFVPLAEMQVGGGTISQPIPPGQTMVVDEVAGGMGSGTAIGSVLNVDTSYYNVGEQLYVWAFDSTVFDTAPAGSLATADWGIFTSNNASWQFSTDPLSLPDLNTGLVSADTVLQGSFEAGGLQVTPEPVSAFFLLLAAGLGLLPRRRKFS